MKLTITFKNPKPRNPQVLVVRKLAPKIKASKKILTRTKAKMEMRDENS